METLMYSKNFLELFLLVVLSFSGLIGIVAVVSPKRFASIALKCGKWVDSDTGLAARPFDEAQAGHPPDAPPGAAKKKAAKKPAAKKSAASTKAKAPTVTTEAKAPARKTKAPAAGKKSGGKVKASKS